MNTQEKSLKLAELMGWEVESDKYNKPVVFSGIKSKAFNGTYYEELCMYSDAEEGLAQFAAILLKFPKVLGHSLVYGCRFDEATMQANILDEILRMNGIDPDA